MNKTQLINAIPEYANVTKIEAKQVVDAFIEVTTNVLKSNERIALVGFGSFSIIDRKARLGRNPSTGKGMTLPPKRIVKFKAGSDLIGQIQ